MSAVIKPPKSSGPQDLAKNADLPAANWGVEKLQEFAIQRYAEIAKAERSLAQAYWLLGVALHYLHKNFHHGQWEQFLKSINITTTRAAKAKAIYESFETMDLIKNLSVDEAYEQRKIKQPRQAKPAKRMVKGKVSTTSHTLQASLQDVVDQAETFHSERLQRFPEQTQELLDAVVAAIAKLEALRQRLSLPAKLPST